MPTPFSQLWSRMQQQGTFTGLFQRIKYLALVTHKGGVHLGEGAVAVALCTSATELVERRDHLNTSARFQVGLYDCILIRQHSVDPG